MEHKWLECSSFQSLKSPFKCVTFIAALCQGLALKNCLLSLVPPCSIAPFLIVVPLKLKTHGSNHSEAPTQTHALNSKLFIVIICPKGAP